MPIFGVLREYHRGAMDGTFTANISQGFGTKIQGSGKDHLSLVAVNVKRLPFFQKKNSLLVTLSGPSTACIMPNTTVTAALVTSRGNEAHMHEHVNPRKASSLHFSLPTGQPKYEAQTQSRATTTTPSHPEIHHAHVTCTSPSQPPCRRSKADTRVCRPGQDQQRN